ncbi:MAG TPA: beta-ketoacyl synthase N-terminal-like domain-containing protein [Sulfuricurvum sp.]|nr:beta-ketoacyl synthase N-terminal-like domain-containing protein [Sulfuricurvum sp.]
MNSSVYVREAVAFCSLGNTPEEIVAGIHSNCPKDFKELAFGQGVLRREYRGLVDQNITQNDEFYTVLKQLLSQLIQTSNLSREELGESALLIGSTSMNIPCSETFFREQPQQTMLPYIGYGEIGEHLGEFFGIGGEVSFFTTACTSSANALLYAQRAIASGRVKRAIVLGFEFYNELTMAGFETLGLLSIDGCRPFDANRSGIVLGEGCAAVLVDSIASDDETQFLLHGGASGCDISSPTSHNVDGGVVARTIRDALRDAKKSLNEVVLIKAHATGTENNDWAEGKGLEQTFAALPPVVALKPFLGHTLGGCGAIELAVLWFCMREGFVPKTNGFEWTDERINISPCMEEQKVREGILLLNHFGFGGSGVVLVVECHKGKDS